MGNDFLAIATGSPTYVEVHSFSRNLNIIEDALVKGGYSVRREERDKENGFKISHETVLIVEGKSRSAQTRPHQVVIEGGFRDGTVMEVVESLNARGPLNPGTALKVAPFAFSDFPYYFGSKTESPRWYPSVEAAVKAVQKYLDGNEFEGGTAKTAKTAMMLLTKEVEARMPALYATENTPMNEKVVQVKFFTPDSNWSWFGIEYDPSERLFFGLVAGLYPEFGYFSLDELESVTGPRGLPIERDMYFSPKTVAEVVRTEGVDIHVAESKRPTQSMLAARPIRKIK
jgi:hypothetical protein